MTLPASSDRQPQVDLPLELRLPRDVQAPGTARAAITELCGERGLGSQLRQTLVLLVSEVISNAVLHSSGPVDAGILMTAVVAEDTVRITVTDAGGGFTPTERDP
jgi:anti-sigma regulatory factor (Ser/Thr protein kinase)